MPVCVCVCLIGQSQCYDSCMVAKDSGCSSRRNAKNTTRFVVRRIETEKETEKTEKRQ